MMAMLVDLERAMQWTVLAVVALNLVWSVPIGAMALRGPVKGWPNAGFCIPLTGLLIGIGAGTAGRMAGATGFVTINLALIAASLILFKLMHISRLVEIEALDGTATGSLRLWRRLWRRR